MRKFVTSMVYGLLMSLFSIATIFLLQAPLVSFIYYGFFSGTNTKMFSANIINKMADAESITIIIIIAQIVLTMAFAFALYIFITKVIQIFLKDEKLIKPYYTLFFFLTIILPVLLIFLSIFLKVKLTILTLIIELVIFALNTVLIIFSKKLFPETTNTEYRKYLFTNGASHE